MEAPTTALLDYYRARAAEYEKVYDKAERQDDLRQLRALVPAFFAGRRVLDIACGTGYWTHRIARAAQSVIAVDLAPETLDVARAKDYAAENVDFRIGDAFALDAIEGGVDAAFAGFWWSHVRLEDLGRFLAGVHARLPAGSPVMMLDNRYVEGSNWPISRRDGVGNTYQLRRLDDGTEHEVVKNFPSRTEVHSAIESAGGVDAMIVTLPHYWYVTYSTEGARRA